jgi:hypothetical protein
MATVSPNMGLLLPTVGIDSGYTWETDINQNTNVLDGHNHSAGSGVQITPLGMNINADLTFLDNNATNLRSTRYYVQSAALSASTDIGCLYVYGADLYYNDTASNQIRITSGGVVNATASGISNGTASASFSSSVLVVDAASNTPANIKCASILMGQTGVSGSNYVSISPPSSLSGGSYSLTLPAVSGSGTQLVLIDTSGNMTASATVSGTIADNIGGEMSSVGANAIAASMTSTGASSIASTMPTSACTTIVNNANSTSIGGYPLLLSNGSGTPKFIWGVVLSNGSTSSGSGFTSAQGGTGSYTITFSTGFSTAQFMIIATSNGTTNVTVTSSVNTVHSVAGITILNLSGNPVNAGFNFFAIG